MEHKHGVYDSDTRFSINPITRQIKNESNKKIVLCQNDHNSEIFTFECPRTIEGHDMSLCNEVEIHFLNIEGKGTKKKSGFYTVKDFQVDPENESKVVCSWVIDRNATGLVGALVFLVRYKCKEEKIITYDWHTEIYKGITISDGINADETFEADYVDIIERWKDSVIRYINDSIHDVTHNFFTVIDSQKRFDEIVEKIPAGGTFKIQCDVHAVNDIVITKPCTIYSDNKSKIIFDAGKFILKDTVTLKDLYISGLTYDFDTISGIINIHAPCTIQGCELDGKTDITDSTNTGVGGYGIALFEGADGTVINNNYIHNVSNSFIENWHNNVDLGHPQVNNLKIINNRLIDSETGDGIALNTNNSVIKGNSLNGKWENGFLVHPKNENGTDCENVIFDGNIFDVTDYQDIKNGYGIAIRQADDQLSASNNCQVINNIFNGWGNTANGVEGIRVDATCRNTVIKGNVFPNKHTPMNAACIRDWGFNTIIEENKIDIVTGVYAIQKCGGCGKILHNNIIISGNAKPVVITNTYGQICVMGNTIAVQNSTENQAIYVQEDDVHFLYNHIIVDKGGISTNTSAKGLLVDGNIFETGGTALNIYCPYAKIINNFIRAGFDGIALYQQSNNAFVFNNDLETVGESGRDCLINYGENNVIDHNVFHGAVRNALKVTEAATERCVISNNLFFSGSAIALENYLDLIQITGNQFDAPNITYAGSGIVKFDNNVGVNVTRINGIPLIFDGELLQSAIPGSGGANDIAKKCADFISAHNITVIYTSVEPNQYYKLMSNGTWKNIF